MTRRARAEPFGAWVRLDDATLVAVDHALARRIGIADDATAHTLPRPPLEAHIAVTSRCAAGCVGCYQSATRDGDHVDRGDIDRTLRALAEEGVFTVAFGGGEPLSRDDVGTLATHARALGLTPVVTTSGLGITPDRARALRDFAQVNVSHDGVGDGYATVRGFDGASMADRAIRTLVDAGVPVGVNHVLTRQNVDGLDAMAAHARSLGARELQLLRYKPAGRAASLDYLARRLTPAQVTSVVAAIERLSVAHEGELSLRVDCAMVPWFVDRLADATSLARYGVFGCEAGGHLAAVRRDGARLGCSFVTDDDAVLSLDAFRAFVATPPEPCASCALRAVCRGGCKIVSRHVTGALSPDPECPRVMRAALLDVPHEVGRPERT